MCDRAIVIFGGRVVAEIGVADADERPAALAYWSCLSPRLHTVPVRPYLRCGSAGV